MYIKVVVSTKMKKDSILAENKDHFVVSVKDKPENNMANKKVINIIASYFKVPISKIRIINGHHHPHKLLVVDIKR